MKLLFEKRKFKKSLFFAKIFIFKLFFHEKCPELGKLQYFVSDQRDLKIKNIDKASCEKTLLIKEAWLVIKRKIFLNLKI
jgi:hypothetical protein